MNTHINTQAHIHISTLIHTLYMLLALKSLTLYLRMVIFVLGKIQEKGQPWFRRKREFLDLHSRVTEKLHYLVHKQQVCFFAKGVEIHIEQQEKKK